MNHITYAVTRDGLARANECAFCGVPDTELYIRMDGLPVCGHCHDWELGEPLKKE